MSVDRIDPRGSNDDKSMSVARSYNDDELMAVLLSREVRDGEISACGALSQLPATGLLLAKHTHAQDAELIIARLEDADDRVGGAEIDADGLGHGSLSCWMCRV